MTLATHLVLPLVRSDGGLTALARVAKEVHPSQVYELLQALSEATGALVMGGEAELGEGVLRILNRIRVGS